MASHTELLKRLRKNPWNSKYPRMRGKQNVHSRTTKQNKTRKLENLKTPNPRRRSPDKDV
jgi:hypothetical protein